MITIDEGLPVRYHKSNGTYDTALQLTGYDPGLAIIRNFDFIEAALDTAYYRQIIPAMIDFYETALDACATQSGKVNTLRLEH